MRYGDLTALQEREYCKKTREAGCEGCPMFSGRNCYRALPPALIPIGMYNEEIPDPRQTVADLRVPDLVGVCRDGSDACDGCAYFRSDDDGGYCALCDNSPQFWNDDDVGVLRAPNPRRGR